DLRLGATANRVRASFLPGRDETVEDKIARYGQYTLDLTEGAVLERGAVYIVPLLESLALPPDIHGIANPKSSTGRLDIFTRLIADHTGEFDQVRAGYAGPLYAEISPRTFSIRVKLGTRLGQLRLRQGEMTPSDAALRNLYEREELIIGARNDPLMPGGKIGISIDLVGDPESGLVGYKAKRDAGVIDYDRPGAYDWIDFWEPIPTRADNAIVLNLEDFYILRSKESVSVPPDHAAEMIPYDTLVGEFRVHYAGFFDPGFGHSDHGGLGSRAVLEVRPHEVPFMVEDGQIVGKLVYEPLMEIPDRLYGKGMGSSYQAQGLRLSKHFRI
ncbi:MAG: 2'-deoxycytidine 5'-triphosphate deaminase, partial [Rhodospirillaceae bacterium]|nr:2'-deoxycytidine 5'-triphosphate deaminase [Rhodospirillaceae bacterium]